MSVQTAAPTPAPSVERAARMLERARVERLVTREQRRFARQMHAHAAGLMRGARAPRRA